MAADPLPKSGTSRARRRILFFAEAVTLAHVARPAVLASGLDRAQFEVHVAADPRYRRLFPELEDIRHDLWSVSSQSFVEALAKGAPVYSRADLRRYVEDDLSLIDQIRPDIIVGDFRLSLSISARLRQVPYLAISNFYWSPLAQQHFPIPEHPLVDRLGPRLAQLLFTLARPTAFALHSLPLNRVRREFGLQPLGYNLQKAYTDSDRLLFADLPELAGNQPLAEHHRFIGPILWSPHNQLPDWWGELDERQPCVYVTLGSSGRSDLLPRIIEALKDLPLQLLVTTAGHPAPDILADNVFYAPYLPGKEATERADLLICNGGSMSCYQALACGVPVIGVAGNLDQHLNMQALERLGMGVGLRNDGLRAERLRADVEVLLAAENRSASGRQLQREVLASDPCGALIRVLEGDVDG